MKKILKIIAYIEFGAAILTTIGSAASPLLEAYKVLTERLDALLTKEEREEKERQKNEDENSSPSGSEFQEATIVESNTNRV